MKCGECGQDLQPGELYVEARVIPHDPPTLDELGGPRFIHARQCPTRISERDGHYFARIGRDEIDLGTVENYTVPLNTYGISEAMHRFPGGGRAAR